MSDSWSKSFGPPPARATDDQHLLDNELGAPRDPAAQKHFGACPYCRAREREATLASAQPESGTSAAASDPFDDDDLFADAIDAMLASPLRATPVQLPTGAWALVADAAPTVDIAVGQLWRLAWADHRQLVVVLGIHTWWADVAPVSFDTAFGDEHTLLVDASHSPLLTDLAVFVSLEAAVPLYTFEAHLGAVELSPIAENGSTVVTGAVRAVDALVSLRASWRRGGQVAVDVPTGRRSYELDLEGIAYRDALRAELQPFASAGIAERSIVEIDLPQLLDSITSEQWEVLGLRRGDLLAVARGQAVLTTELAEPLAQLWQIPASDLIAASRPGVDEDDLAVVSEPAFRSRVDAWGVRHSLEPTETRRELARRLSTSAARATRAVDIAEREQRRDRLRMLLADDGL